MGKLWNLIVQKFNPASKKKLLIKVRYINGAWEELMLKPTTTAFRIKGDKEIYYIQGSPDIDNSTNQRTYTFLQGVKYPVRLNNQHPETIIVQKSEGSEQLLLTEGEEVAFQKAMLLKGKKGFDPLLLVLMVVGLNLMATLFIGFAIMQKLGINFFG